MEIPYTISTRPDTGLWNAKVGIWLFLASEVMLFGGLFSAYIFLRLDAQPGEWPHGLLNVPVGTMNTAILIMSSVTVVLAWVTGSLPFFLLPRDRNLYWACTWFVGSFALGMAGAVIGFSPSYRDSALRDRVPWGLLTVVAGLALAALCVMGFADLWPYPVVDLIVSVLAVFSINSCLEPSTRSGEGRNLAKQILGSRALAYLGGFSYSLYLVQHPILRFTDRVLDRLPLSYDANIAVRLLFVTPLVIALAWVFSEFFERPFTTGSVLLPALQALFGKTRARNQAT